LSSATRSIAVRLGRGGGWAVAATAASQGSIFLTSVILANLFGPDVFGSFSLLWTTVLTLSSLASLGTGLAALKFVAEYRSVSPVLVAQAASECLRFGTLGGIAAAFFAAVLSGPISAQVLAVPALQFPLVLASAAVFLNSRANVLQGVISGFEGFASLARVNAIHGCFYLVTCVVGALLWGVAGAAIGMTLASFCRLVLLDRAGKQVSGAAYASSFTSSSVDVDLRKRLHSFMLPSAVAGLSTMPSIWICSLFVARLDNGIVEVAWFSVALSWRSIVVLLPALFSSVSSVLLNDYLGQKDLLGFKRVLLVNTGLMTVVGLVAGAGVLAAGDFVLAAYGPGFGGAKPALLAAMVLACAEIIGGSLHTVIVARAQMWRLLLWVTLPRDIASIWLAWTFSTQYGAAGAIFGIAIAWAVGAIVIAVWTNTLLKGLDGKAH